MKNFCRIAALIAMGVILVLNVGQWSEIDKDRDVDTAYAATKTGQSVVGIVRSDYAKLKHPALPDTQLTDAQIEEMVREAVTLAGGLQTVITPDARWITIKPNIVEVTTAGSGVITDWRVVKAVVKLAHEVAPEARISIVEGPGEWMAPDVPGADTLSWNVADGWAVAGYRNLLKDPELQGVRLDLIDLNVDEAIETVVPDQWCARERYWVPKTVLDCDALIDVPVMKIHDGPGMTCAMKNFVGTAPGIKYGKARGYPGHGPGIPHTPQIIDEVIVDLTSLANPKFTVVDAIVGMEKEKTAYMGGNPIRMNTIVAGSDVVAVDATCARLMGLNPDDLEFLTLATHKGLGRMDEEQIKVNGQTVEEVKKKFEKPPVDWMGMWGEMGHYGQSNRTWLLKGPFPLLETEVVDLNAKVVPEQDGWSEAVYFGDDKIDLRSYFKDAVNCVVYAYTELTAPKTQEAELWVGSGEGLTVWIDGTEVYQFKGTRRHKLPNDKLKIKLTEGKHSLLIRVEQTRGVFDFSLNICEVETDERYSGNRVSGLRFSVPSAKEVSQMKVPEVAGFTIEEWLGGKMPDWLESGTWTTYTIENGFPLRRASSITFGLDGSAWVGGGGGVARFDGTIWKVWGQKEGFDVRRVTSMALDSKGHIWVMTDKGIFEFDGEKWINRFGGGNSKGSLTIDNSDRIWVGAHRQGLSLYDEKDAKTYGLKDGLPNENVLGIATDRAGSVWLATYGGGAIRFDGKNWKAYTVRSSGLGDNHLLCIALDNNGAPWVGADGGGVSHLENERWVTYGPEEGFGDPSARCITLDRAGHVWVALGGWDTRGRDGISIFDGKQWTTGLSSESVECIVTDPEGNVWLGSESGLVKFTLRKD